MAGKRSTSKAPEFLSPLTAPAAGKDPGPAPIFNRPKVRDPLGLVPGSRGGPKK